MTHTHTTANTPEVTIAFADIADMPLSKLTPWVYRHMQAKSLLICLFHPSIDGKTLTILEDLHKKAAEENLDCSVIFLLSDNA